MAGGTSTLALDRSTERRGPAAPSADLLARKGRASVRGFGTAATVDTVAAEVARATRPPTAIAFDRARRPMRALIADGDALSRKLYRDLLEADGYDVVVAADGIEALQAVRRQAPDIAVVNLRLAELSGLEVARRINDDDAVGGIPVVAVAEMFRPGDEAASRAGGCAAYLAKPISVRIFLDTIDRLMHSAGRFGPD